MKERRLTEVDVMTSKKLKAIFNAKKGELKLTQEAAADLLGWTQGMVGHYLNGRRSLGLSAIVKISNLLGIDAGCEFPELMKQFGIEELPPALQSKDFLRGLTTDQKLIVKNYIDELRELTKLRKIKTRLSELTRLAEKQ